MNDYTSKIKNVNCSDDNIASYIIECTTKNGKPAGKTYTINNDGKVDKAKTPKPYQFKCRHLPIYGVNNPLECLRTYEHYVKNLTLSQFLVLGQCPLFSPDVSFEIDTQSRLSRYKSNASGYFLTTNGTPVISRSKAPPFDFIKPSNLLLIDYDTRPEGDYPNTHAERWKLIAAAIPEFKDAANITYPSGSGRVIKPDGTLYKPNNTHTIIALERTPTEKELKGFKAIIEDKLKAGGLSYSYKNGVGEQKGYIIDTGVFSAEREVFEANPAIIDSRLRVINELKFEVSGTKFTPVFTSVSSDIFSFQIEALPDEILSPRALPKQERFDTASKANHDYKTLTLDTMIRTIKHGEMKLIDIPSLGLQKVECHAINREDRNPSAAVFINYLNFVVHDFSGARNFYCEFPQEWRADVKQKTPLQWWKYSFKEALPILADKDLFDAAWRKQYLQALSYIDKKGEQQHVNCALVNEVIDDSVFKGEETKFSQKAVDKLIENPLTPEALRVQNICRNIVIKASEWRVSPDFIAQNCKLNAEGLVIFHGDDYVPKVPTASDVRNFVDAFLYHVPLRISVKDFIQQILTSKPANLPKWAVENIINNIITRRRERVLRWRKMSQPNHVFKTVQEAKNFIYYSKWGESIFVVRAPHGAGKTSGIIKPLVDPVKKISEDPRELSKDKRAVVVAPTTSLVDDITSRLNLADYRNRRNGLAKCFATCSPSITHPLIRKELKEPSSLLAFDESHSIFSTALDVYDGTLGGVRKRGIIKDRRDWLDTALEALQSADIPVLLDADNGDDTIAILTEALTWNYQRRLELCQQAGADPTTLKQKRIVSINIAAKRMTRKIRNHVPQDKVTTKGRIMKQVINDLAANKSILISCHSAEWVRQIEKSIKKIDAFKAKRILAVHAQPGTSTTGERAVIKVLSNINTELHNYDVVIYSPAIRTGVSIERRFDSYIIVGGASSYSTPIDFIQQVLRARGDDITADLYFDAVKRPMPKGDKPIRAGLLNVDEDNIEKGLAELAISLREQRNFLLGNYESALGFLMEDLGWEIERVNEVDGSEFFNTAIRTIGDHDFNTTVAQAPKLDKEKALKLSQAYTVTTKQSASLYQSDVRDHLGREDPLTPEDIQYFRKGKFTSAAVNRLVQLAAHIPGMKADEGNFKGLRRNILYFHDLIKRAFDALGLDEKHCNQILTQENLDNFQVYLDTNGEQWKLGAALGCKFRPVGKDDESNHRRPFVNALTFLKKFGFYLKNAPAEPPPVEVNKDTKEITEKTPPAVEPVGNQEAKPQQPAPERYCVFVDPHKTLKGSTIYPGVKAINQAIVNLWEAREKQASDKIPHRLLNLEPAPIFTPEWVTSYDIDDDVMRLDILKHDLDAHRELVSRRLGIHGDDYEITDKNTQDFVDWMHRNFYDLLLKEKYPDLQISAPRKKGASPAYKKTALTILRALKFEVKELHPYRQKRIYTVKAVKPPLADLINKECAATFCTSRFSDINEIEDEVKEISEDSLRKEGDFDSSENELKELKELKVDDSVLVDSVSVEAPTQPPSSVKTTEEMPDKAIINSNEPVAITSENLKAEPQPEPAQVSVIINPQQQNETETMEPPKANKPVSTIEIIVKQLGLKLRAITPESVGAVQLPAELEEEVLKAEMNLDDYRWFKRTVKANELKLSLIMDACKAESISLNELKEQVITGKLKEYIPAVSHYSRIINREIEG